MGSTFQFGLACFLLFFGLSQFFQWADHLTLPLPIFVLGGAFLAIASNFNKRAGLPFSLLDDFAQKPPEPVSDPVSPQPTPVEAVSQPQKPISFTIRKPEN